MPHPYAALEDSALWRAIDTGLRSLEDNGDLTLTTARLYVIGSLCQRLIADGLTTASPSAKGNHALCAVAIVLDPQYGDQLPGLAARMPVWIHDTPINRSATENLWSATVESGSSTPVTTFRSDPTISPERAALEVLATVMEHHDVDSQPMTVNCIEFVGCTPDSQLLDTLAGYSLVQFRSVAGGWRASVAEMRRTDA